MDCPLHSNHNEMESIDLQSQYLNPFIYNFPLHSIVPFQKRYFSSIKRIEGEYEEGENEETKELFEDQRQQQHLFHSHPSHLLSH